MKREELIKVAKPSPFNTDMVEAILEGDKTSFRKLIKVDEHLKPIGSLKDYSKVLFGTSWDGTTIHDYKEVNVPYRVDDILYVKETWKKLDTSVLVDLPDNSYDYIYKASENGKVWERESVDWTWCPSTHMPKEAARIFLKVTKIRVEKLQDITFEGCKAEGIIDDYKTLTQEYHDNLARAAYPIVFSQMWDEGINKKDVTKYGWKANPYVFVIDFEVIEPE